MSLTASVGLMAVFLVDFVDMVFISMLGKAELAAAVGYAGAVLFFTTSFGIGMAIAAGALVARALGAGETDLARQRATNSLLLGTAFGAVFAALVWGNLPMLVALLGASGETLDLAVHYLRIIIPTLPLLIVGMVGGAILRAHGDARRAMMATIWAGVVNAVLDPILIFGLDLELTGAALASVAARVTIAATALLPIIRHYGGFTRPTASGLRTDLAPVAAIAGPAILTQLATPIGQAYVTRAMAEFGEDAVAGMAIVARMTPVAFGVLFALSGAVGPIIGQNHGGGRPDRVRRTFADALLFTAIVVRRRHRDPLRAARTGGRSLQRDRRDARACLSLLRAAGAGVLLQRRDLRLERGLQQPRPPVPFDLDQLGPSHAWNDPAGDTGGGDVRRAGSADRAGSGRTALRADRLLSCSPGHGPHRRRKRRAR